VYARWEADGSGRCTDPFHGCTWLFASTLLYYLFFVAHSWDRYSRLTHHARRISSIAMYSDSKFVTVTSKLYNQYSQPSSMDALVSSATPRPWRCQIPVDIMLIILDNLDKSDLASMCR